VEQHYRAADAFRRRDLEVRRRAAGLEAAATRRYPRATVTAKEKLRRAVEELSETEAAEALEILVRRRERTVLDELLDGAPLDDESTTSEEGEGAREARAEIARGEVFSAEEIKREIA
jgi:hypothetical protein